MPLPLADSGVANGVNRNWLNGVVHPAGGQRVPQRIVEPDAGTMPPFTALKDIS